MVVVPLHHVHPLPGEAADGGIVEHLRVGHLARDQKAQAVRPIEIARVLDLLMLEVNGLMTYDRKPKFDSKALREMNQMLR